MDVRGATSVSANINRASTAVSQPKTTGQQFGSVMKTVASVGLQAAGAVVPGASTLTNALGNALGSSAGSSFGNTPGLNGSDMVNNMMQMNMQFLALQSAMEQGTRQFNTLSNASKCRHESAMASIRNMK
mgnify:CR=1 FL=1